MKDELLKLSAASRLLEGTNPRALRRYILEGLNGIKLEAVLVKNGEEDWGRYYTSAKWLREFFERVAETSINKVLQHKEPKKSPERTAYEESIKRMKKRGWL